MASYENFYSGTNYGLDPDFNSKDFVKLGYRTPASAVGLTTDARSANQLKEVGRVLSTGAKAIEVQGTFTNVLDAIPDQHLEEINRLKKLAGAELTFHGPMVEPTGVTRQGWDESHREQAEAQILNGLERGHKLDPDGNIVVTFHSSHELPSSETRVFNKETGKEEVKDFLVIDEQTGRLNNLGPEVQYLAETDEEFKKDPKQAMLNKINQQAESQWLNSLQQVNFHAYRGASDIDEITRLSQAEKSRLSPELVKKWEDENIVGELYKAQLEGKGDEIIQQAEKDFGEDAARILKGATQKMSHGEIYLRDAFQNLQGLFKVAYENAKKTDNFKDQRRLEEYRKRILNKRDMINDPTKVGDFAEEVVRGVNLLRSVETPVSIKPFKEFSIDKASDTFANAAFKAYKKFGDTAPVVSIENPPAGSGLSRADELKAVVTKSREKFTSQAIDSGMTESEAKKQAEKLIGATWDVGHINMIRKYGYGKKELLKETKEIAPFIKNIHLSDNFGLEHTELPMGYGNVPIKEEMEIIHKYNKAAKKAKQIVETGTWFQHFQSPNPFRKTLEAFGSPVYLSESGPSWDTMGGISSSYLGGMGEINPSIHHQQFGAGYTSLPPTLGGPIAGGQSRLSGTPIQ